MRPAVSRFNELVVALESGETSDDGTVSITLPAETVSWLHDGCVRYASGRSSELSKALGLRGAGHDSTAGEYRRESRNEHLALAFQCTVGKSAYQRCESLGYTIRQFETRVWPRIQHETEPPDRLTETQKHLFAAFKIADRIPSSTSYLYRNIAK